MPDRIKALYSEPVFQHILETIRRIEWEVEEIGRNSLMAKRFAEQVFERSEKPPRRYFTIDGQYYYNSKNFYLNRSSSQGSSVFWNGNLGRLTAEDRRYIHSTEYMDMVLRPSVEHNPHILFTHIVSRKGVTRGYPWKDFSVLPLDFDPTKQIFFYTADPEHNPERKIQWTEPYKCPLAKKWMATCSCPVYKNDDFVCVIGIDVDLERIITPLGDALDMTRGAYAFLVSPEGSLLISSAEGMDSLREENVLIGKEWKGLREKQDPSDRIKVGKVTLTSGQAYLLHTQFKTNKWDLICILPAQGMKVTGKTVSRAAEDGRPAAEQQEPAGTPLPLMSFLSSFANSLREIEKLIEGTKTIGRGVLDHRIVIDRNDEIGLFASAINKMAEELKKRRDEFKSAYEKINQMDRLSALGILAAGIAHEINNPLGIISNCVQMLLKSSYVQGFIKQELLIIEEEIGRMSEIIKQLLNMSRDSEMKMGVVQVSEILQRTLVFLKFELHSHSIRVVENYDNDLPLVLGDSTHLHQAFLNILLNAVQAMSNGGILRVSIRHGNGARNGESREAIEIRIADTGKGIEKKHLGKIFDPFFTTGNLRKGTGLGLSITHGIIKEHNGTIDVQSSPGKGTSVRISLPVLG